jgi:O-antigen/teichoic acid export membrane protein
MISKSFLKSSLIFTIGGALPMAASITLLPFYANQLDDLNYAKVLFYIQISALFQILFSFSTDSYFGVKYSQLFDDEEKRRKFTGTVSALLLIIGGGLTLLSLCFGNVLFRVFTDTDLVIDFWPYGFYAILTGFLNSYFKTASIYLIYAKKARLFFSANLINFFATIVISVGGLYLFPGTIIGPMYGRLLSGVVIFIIGHYIFVRNGTFSFDTAFFREMAAFCFPYMLYALCGWILAGSDRYILLKFNIEISNLNAYDLLLKCFVGIEFLLNSLSAVVFPRLYEIWARNKENKTTPESNRYFNVFTAVNIIQLILFCIAIPWIYKLFITNTTFYESERYIGILAAGYALRSIFSFYQATILFTKHISIMFKVFGLSTLFQLIFTVIAARYSGLEGVIYVSLATKILQVVLCALFTRPIFEYRFNVFKIVVVPALYVIINVVQFIVYKQYSLSLYLLQLLVFSGLFYGLFRNEIRKVLAGFHILKPKE